jgi:hypothetical protein
MVFRKIRLSPGRSGFAQGPLIAKELTWLKMRRFLRKRSPRSGKRNATERAACLLPAPLRLVTIARN